MILITPLLHEAFCDPYQVYGREVVQEYGEKLSHQKRYLWGMHSPRDHHLGRRENEGGYELHLHPVRPWPHVLAFMHDRKETASEEPQEGEAQSPNLKRNHPGGEPQNDYLQKERQHFFSSSLKSHNFKEVKYSSLVGAN